MVATKKSVLLLENVEKRFSGKVIIQGFSGQVSTGDRILVTGPNGSGKTTLLKIMADLLAPDQGLAVSSKKISWLPTTESGLWARLSGLESLRFYAQLWKVSETTFQKQLESWSALPAFRESLPVLTQNLSTGRRQLLHFARILFNQPELIVMDEPFRSLDPNNIAFVTKQFETWASDSAIIWSSPIIPPQDQNYFHQQIWALKEPT